MAKVKMTKKEARLREAKYLADLEAQSIKEYNTKRFQKVVPGSIKRGSGKFKGKITVLVNTLGTDGKPDGLRRECATGDVFQVHYQEDVAVILRYKRRNERNRAKRREARLAASK